VGSSPGRWWWIEGKKGGVEVGVWCCCVASEVCSDVVDPPELKPTFATASAPGFEGLGPNKFGKDFDAAAESSLAGGVAAVILTIAKFDRCSIVARRSGNCCSVVLARQSGTCVNRDKCTVISERICTLLKEVYGCPSGFGNGSPRPPCPQTIRLQKKHSSARPYLAVRCFLWQLYMCRHLCKAGLLSTDLAFS
jgi:hypothetical protein